MRVAEHSLIPPCEPCPGTEKIGNPPRLQFAEEQKRVADAKVPKQPVQIGAAKIIGACGEAERKGSRADECTE